jgi:hypothetical protein
VGDGPDWRQLDRAQLLAARAQGEETGRKKVLEEWIGWLSTTCQEACLRYTSGPELVDVLSEKLEELRARLSSSSVLPSESKTTALPETLPAPLAETKTTE